MYFIFVECLFIYSQAWVLIDISRTSLLNLENLLILRLYRLKSREMNPTFFKSYNAPIDYWYINARRLWKRFGNILLVR